MSKKPRLKKFLYKEAEFNLEFEDDTTLEMLLKRAVKQNLKT